MRNLVFLAFVLLFFSCSSNGVGDKEQLENGVLSIDEFTKLMTDVQLLEGHLNTNRVNQVFVMDSAKNYYKEIFNRYKITEKEYKENLKYYTAKPKVLEEVYKKIEERLVIQERLYKDITITQPAISPINKTQLINIISKDTGKVNLLLDTTLSYIQIKNTLFSFYNDSILKNANTNHLSFQQSFNVATHTQPLFNLFREELKRKIKKEEK